MSTATAAPTAAQFSTEQAAAIAAAMANPLTAWLDHHEALGSIDLTQFDRRSPERRAIDRAWGRSCHEWHLDAPGIGLACEIDAWDQDGVIQTRHAVVTSVEEFLEQWGAPVTHARALEIAQTRLSELDGAWRDEAEDRLNKVSEEHAREAHELRGV